MIRTQLAIDEMRPADAYALGFQDCSDSYDLDDADAGPKSYRELVSLLDRVWEIAPYGPLAPAPMVDPAPFDGDVE